MKVISAQTRPRRWPGDYPERMSSLTKLELTQVSLRLGSCFVEQSKKTGCASSSTMRNASILFCERKRSNTPGGRTWGRYDTWARKCRADFCSWCIIRREAIARNSRTEIYACSRASKFRATIASFATLRIFSCYRCSFLSLFKMHKMHYIFKSRWKLHKSLDLK